MLGSVAMLPISALGYDERCKWERYALSMPLQKKICFSVSYCWAYWQEHPEQQYRQQELF